MRHECLHRSAELIAFYVTLGIFHVKREREHIYTFQKALHCIHQCHLPKINLRQMPHSLMGLNNPLVIFFVFFSQWLDGACTNPNRCGGISHPTKKSTMSCCCTLLLLMPCLRNNLTLGEKATKILLFLSF